MSNPEHVSVIYIKATRDKVWEALTSAEFTQQYFHHTQIRSDWEEGDSVTFYNQDQSIAVQGKVLIADKPDKLSYTWHVHYNPQAKLEEPSRVTYLLETVEDSTKLTLIHDQFPLQSVVYPQISEGWIAILCNLKTLLETESVMAIS